MTDTNGQSVTTESAPSAPEMVELHEASDADLDAFLESQQTEAPEAEAPPQPVKQPAPTAPVPEPSEAETSEAQAEASETDVGERLEKLQRQLDGLELVTKRRTSELGEVKKRLEGFISQANAGLEEKLATNPVEGTKDILRIREAEEHLSRVQAAEQELVQARQNQEAVLRNVDLEETPIDAIAQVFLNDGISPEVVQQFKANPWLVPATTTIQAAKRAKAEGYLRVLVPEFKKLQAELKKLKGGSQEALRKIESVAKEIPGVTAASGGVAAMSADDLDSTPIHMMTDAQLEAYLRKVSR